MTAIRSVGQRQTLERHQMTPSFSSFGLRSTPGFSLDPFLNLDDFLMSQPTFPPHPHAGFSAVTYLFEDSGGAFLNRDSLGDRSRIEPGALHWTQAGRGMLHEEIPERPGEQCHGLQMFVNLRDEHKRAAPAAFHASRGEIPEARPSPGARVRVLVGAFGGLASPIAGLLTPITLLDVHLDPGARVEIDAPRDQTAFALLVRGGATVAGGEVRAHEAVRFAADGEAVRFEGGAAGVELLFGAGAPIGEPVVFGGPFVMTRHADVEDARARFARGEMGFLAPSLGRA